MGPTIKPFGLPTAAATFLLAPRPSQAMRAVGRANTDRDGAELRYIRPREFPLNPRMPTVLLDPVVQRLQSHRRTVTEAITLGEIWSAGEDLRLREDPRFWELADVGHFHLAQQRLANRVLADRLWKGVWDGRDID